MNTKLISPNVVWQMAGVNRESREKQNGHSGAIIWFTGLSGSGKSTLAYAVEIELHTKGYRTFVLDGDNVRHGLCGDLGFSSSDRVENIRRIGEVAKLFMEAGIVVLTSFISPFQADRERVRQMVKKGDFVEVYCDSPIEVCERRDVKGMYKKARDGFISDFTGISSPYEKPLNPEIIIDTANQTQLTCVQTILDEIEKRNIRSSVN
ncbi:adenylyl-sulfate kinase [Undibacterium sp. RuRC25W]|uniref:adenylyl-sulfate kinase n=1 Tax=Undibacterium sp. RuRC25W TaxID=3413047 RepID=UPI003BF2E4BD